MNSQPPHIRHDPSAATYLGSLDLHEAAANRVVMNTIGCAEGGYTHAGQGPAVEITPRRDAFPQSRPC